MNQRDSNTGRQNNEPFLANFKLFDSAAIEKNNQNVDQRMSQDNISAMNVKKLKLPKIKRHGDKLLSKASDYNKQYLDVDNDLIKVTQIV